MPEQFQMIEFVGRTIEASSSSQFKPRVTVNLAIPRLVATI